MSESTGAGTSASTATITSTTAPQAQPSPAPSAVAERHRIKVEGSEIELTLDELKRDYQLKEASNRRFQQASEMAKKAGPAMEAFEALQRGDIAKAKKLLPPAQFRQAMENYLIEELEYEQLPEYEQRRIEAEKRATALQKQLDDMNEGQNKEKNQRELAAAGMQVDQEIGDMLKKMGKNPTFYLVGAIVDEMLASLDGKGEVLTAEKAYTKAQARLNGGIEAYFGDLSDQEFLERLPPQRIEAVRKHLMSQVRNQQAPRQQTQQSAPLRREDGKPKSIDEAFAEREAQLKSQRRKA